VTVQSVVERLQTGDVTNVVQYGTERLPRPPYVVVRPERDPFRGRALRIIAHYLPDQQRFLEDYVFNKLPDLLSGYEGDTDEGVHFKVEATDEYTDIIAGNDDGTISMERVFLLPGRLF